MIRGVRGMLLAAVLVAAGCSGGDDGAEPTVAPTVQSTTPPTTVAPTTTAPPPTTPAPTTAPPTTLPPPTTPPTAPPTSPPPDPLTDLAATLQRDATAAEQALLAAIAAPADPASDALVRRHYVGDSLDRVIEALAFLVENGLVGQPNPDFPSVLLITGEPRPVGAQGSEVEVETCRVDAAVIVLPLSEDPNGPSAVYNDRITRTEALTRFSFQDGVWRVAGGVTISETEGGTSCESP